MARKEPVDPVRSVVEAQAASCRTLAEAMRNHASSLGLMKRSEAKAIDGWADMLAGIADALTAAVHEKDPGALTRIWRFTKLAVGPLLVVGGTVADTMSIVDHFASSEKVTATAHELDDRADEHMAIIINWDPDALSPSEPHHDRASSTRAATDSPEAEEDPFPDPAPLIEQVRDTVRQLRALRAMTSDELATRLGATAADARTLESGSANGVEAYNVAIGVVRYLLDEAEAGRTTLSEDDEPLLQRLQSTALVLQPRIGLHD